LTKACQLNSCQLPKHAYKIAKKEHIAIKNHLNREFDVTAHNQVWCGDVTYIWTGNRWSYLAIVIWLQKNGPCLLEIGIQSVYDWIRSLLKRLYLESQQLHRIICRVFLIFKLALTQNVECLRLFF